MADETPADDGWLRRNPVARAAPGGAGRGSVATAERTGIPGLHHLVEDLDIFPSDVVPGDEFPGDELPSGHLERILRTAVAEVDGARWATITVADESGAVTGAWTDPVAHLIDRVQHDVDDGPVITLGDTPGAVVHSCDLVADRRWPRFSPLTPALGVRSALCHRLGRQSRPVGVLSVYADQAHAFSADSDRVARLLALYAGIALDGEAVQRRLRSAARTRDLIGQAKGMLMERLHLPPDQAFAALVARCAATRSTLHDVARHLIDTGELP